MSDTVDAYGDPLAFRTRPGARRPHVVAGVPGAGVFKVEARQLAGHQKEAVVTEGVDGAAWRVASDEGAHLKGTDLAPFPLGFFNAGLQADLFNRIRRSAAQDGIALSDCAMRLVNSYWLTGSFALGTGEGHAEPATIEIRLRSTAKDAAIAPMIRRAVAASPALALLGTPLVNTFALYINGRRRQVDDVPDSTQASAADPYVVYQRPPRPVNPAERADLIEKTTRRESGVPVAAPATTSTRILRNVEGDGRIGADGLTEIETALALPGTTHFVFRTAEGEADSAPSGLALLSAGIAFCYMTQLSRYIEHMKMNIRGVRLVQFTPFEISAEGRGLAHAIDTHLFLNGEAPDETHARLLTIAARTCYLHATAAASLPPVVTVVHNGHPVN